MMAILLEGAFLGLSKELSQGGDEGQAMNSTTGPTACWDDVDADSVVWQGRGMGICGKPSSIATKGPGRKGAEGTLLAFLRCKGPMRVQMIGCPDARGCVCKRKPCWMPKDALHQCRGCLVRCADWAYCDKLHA